MNLALIGAGQRGMIYASYAYEERGITISAVAEPNDERRRIAGNLLGIPAEHQYDSAEAFFKDGKLADALIIASMDQDHYTQAMKALDLGYDLLLEKPISPDPLECLRIQNKAEEKGCKVIVCHVLRYTNFFSTIKGILDSGELGRIITIQHNENIGNFHMAHSFVRGNWRNSELSSPIIMQKSCHDMDILCWLVGSDAAKISSFGSLTEFKLDNAPEGSSGRCVDCKYVDSCQYSAVKAYLPIAGSWPASAVCTDQSEAGILKALKEGPYGRCVYRCDNNVCDHQISIIEFKNGITADFSLSGFTDKIYRNLTIMCEHGEIRGNDYTNTVEITRFPSNAVDAYEQRVLHPELVTGGHGGGDVGLMLDFLSILDSGSESRSAIQQSVESHIMAYAAERSRITGTVVDMDELKNLLNADLIN